MSRQVQECVNIGHADSLGTVSNFLDLVACPNCSFLQHAKVKSRPAMFNDQSCHARFLHANAEAVAGNARLRDFQYRVTNAVAIADADLVIRKPLDGEIFSKLAEDEILTSEEILPVVIGIHLIDKNGALLSAMTGQIALAVANNIELAHHLPSRHWIFPDRGADGLTVPSYVARKTDIHGEECGHRNLDSKSVWRNDRCYRELATLRRQSDALKVPRTKRTFMR